MKKAFLFVVVLILTAIYVDHVSISIPVALEKRIIEEEQAEAASDASPVIRVMTYNMHRGINRKGKLDLDGIVAVIKSSGAEIIALQEVERFSIRTGFLDQIKYMADKLSMQYAFGKSINILNGEYGNGILSKFPIEEYEVNKLPSEGETRILLKARLNVKGKKLLLFNTHLGLKQNERNMQIEEILRFTGGENNFLLAGDFNTGVDKLDAITAKLVDSGSFGDNNNMATFEKDEISERIDYIFTPESLEVMDYSIIESDASDHYPVISILKFVD